MRSFTINLYLHNNVKVLFHLICHLIQIIFIYVSVYLLDVM